MYISYQNSHWLELKVIDYLKQIVDTLEPQCVCYFYLKQVVDDWPFIIESQSIIKWIEPGKGLLLAIDILATRAEIIFRDL